MFDFRVEVYVESGFYGSDYAFLQADDLFRICLTGVIDDHKRLLFPYCSSAAAVSCLSEEELETKTEAKVDETVARRVEVAER